MLSLPRASYEARLKKTRYDDLKPDISTHAPHTRRDIFTPQCVPRCRDFYSRASYEARPARNWRRHQFLQFLLTRLIRGATKNSLLPGWTSRISTHAPHTRRDDFKAHDSLEDANFYSRASYEARLGIRPCLGIAAISTHAPHTRRDSCVASWWAGSCKFLLTRLIRGATDLSDIRIRFPKDLYSRASYEARPTYWRHKSRFIYDFYSRASYEARQLFRNVLYFI